MESNSAPDLFKFHDYRQFIRELLDFYKKTKSGPSLRGLAEELGVKAPYLSYILSGLRPISEKTRDRLFKYLKFDEDQRAYFMLLCVISDTDNISERKTAFDQLQQFRKYRKLNPRDTEAYRFLTAWYYPAIREMVQLPGFKLDAHWIQEHLSHPVSIEDINKAIHFLIKNGYIEEKDGKVTSLQKDIECTDGVYKIALGTFHRDLLKMAGESIETVARDERHIFGQMMPIPISAIPEVRQLLDDCFKKILKLSDNIKDPNSIYHVGFYSFPVAKVGNEK